jgi:hypothetical protein
MRIARRQDIALKPLFLRERSSLGAMPGPHKSLIQKASRGWDERMEAQLCSPFGIAHETRARSINRFKP